MRSIRALTFGKAHAEWPILAQKPRYPTGDVQEREYPRVGRFCDLVFLLESNQSTRSNLPRRGFVRGIPRFLCQNSLLAAYFIRNSISFLVSFTRKSPPGDPYSRALALGALRTRTATSSNLKTRPAFAPEASLPGFPGRLSIAIVFLRQLARRLDQLAPIACAPHQLADSYLAPARANSRPSH